MLTNNLHGNIYKRNLILNGHGKKILLLHLTHQKEHLYTGEVFNTDRQESSGETKENEIFTSTCAIDAMSRAQSTNLLFTLASWCEAPKIEAPDTGGGGGSDTDADETHTRTY